MRVARQAECAQQWQSRWPECGGQCPTELWLSGAHGSETQGTLGGGGEKSGKLGGLSNPLGLATMRISILEP